MRGKFPPISKVAFAGGIILSSEIGWSFDVHAGCGACSNRAILPRLHADNTR